MADMSLSLGKPFGVEIELHWTFILLMLFILFISAYYFVIWVLLFVFVLLHELTHALVAKSYKLKVKRIILYPLGGGTVISPNELAPSKELPVSISGPIASLIIALVLWLPSFYAGPTIGPFLSTLALINLILGVFNLLPWLPLDGGRALRSYLERNRSHLNATRSAVMVSNITTAVFLMGSTAYAFLNGSYDLSYKGLFILFNVAVAAFIYFGAQSELSHALLKERIRGLKVKDAMSRDYSLVEPDSDIRQLRKKHRGTKPHIILFKYKEAVYVLSSAAVQRAVMRRKDSDLRVKNFGALINPISFSAPLIEAIDTMNESDSNILYVLHSGKISGILQRQRVDYVVGLNLADGKPIK